MIDEALIETKLVCAHCGLEAHKEIEKNGLFFCCHGCKTAHEFLKDNDSCEIPHPAPPRKEDELAWLDVPGIVDKWVFGRQGNTLQVRLKIPGIHCASCVQVLEHLYLRQPGIVRTEVNFLRKELEVSFDPAKLSFSGLIAWLDSLGYRPEMTDPDNGKKPKGQSESTLLTLRMAVAGFCAGNIMLLSFPEYLGLEDEGYRHFFGWLNLVLALPAVFFSGWVYLKSVYIGITKQVLNIDVPIGVGMIATLALSLYETTTQTGAGYFDSLTGLIFFLLIGRWVQSRTFDFLSFERDFKSYFPLSITRMEEGKEHPVLSSEIKSGDVLKIRHGEIIPCDGILLEGDASIDYSFVSGESRTETILPGQMLYAGGKQTSGSLILRASQEMSRSQLVTLWNNPVFEKEGKPAMKSFTDTVARYFTPVILIFALAVAVFWLFVNPSISLHAFVSILIIACPCTLSLAYPMALGNTMRLLGKQGFFLKNAEVVEKISQVGTLVFDKTGTLSNQFGIEVQYHGIQLEPEESAAISAVLSSSVHPLSKAVVQFLNLRPDIDARAFKEIKGKGVKGIWKDYRIQAGSADWVGVDHSQENGSAIYLRINEEYKGCFTVQSAPLPFVEKLMSDLSSVFRLYLLSGDHAKGQDFWESLFKRLKGQTLFAQSPENKLRFIKNLQNHQHVTAMVGDGLNDAGALRQAEVGIAIAATAHQFTPGSDGILLAEKLEKLPEFFRMAKNTMRVVRLSFIISLIYNVVGLTFAVAGELEPVVAAILMPASSLSVVLFAWVGTEWIRYK